MAFRKKTVVEKMASEMPDNPIRDAELKRKLEILRTDFIKYAAINLKIKTKKGEIEPLVLNPPQLYLHQQIEKQLAETGKVRIVGLKGRQQGFSTYSEGRLYWKTTLNRGKSAYILTHEQAATDNLFKMAKRYYDNSHDALKPAIGSSNVKEFLFAALDSGYKVGTAGSKAVGRSGTHQYFHGCLAEGTREVDAETGGLKYVEDFRIGDLALTHTGKVAPVTFISEQYKPCVEVVLRTLGKFPLIATREHKFWTKNGWAELGDLKEGDSIGYPIREIIPDKQVLRLPETRKRIQNGGMQGIYPDEIALTLDFGKVVGLYLAEGYISLGSKGPKRPQTIKFAVHEKEVDRTVQWLNPFKDYFKSLRVITRIGSKTCHVVVYGNRFAELFYNLCGRVEGKHLPYGWWLMPREFCVGMLQGYISGDGSSYSTDRRVRASSIRAEIIIPLREMAASLGYGWAAVEHKEAGIMAGRNEKECFTFCLCGDGATRLAYEIGKPSPEIKNTKTVSVFGNAARTTEVSGGYAWLRIRSIADAGVRKVYDFEIGHDDHSYCTIHGASHNSEVSAWENAYEHFAGVMECIPDEDGTEIILESTARGCSGKFYDIWMQAVRGEGEYRAIFVPWFWSPEYRKDATGFEPTQDELEKQTIYGVDLEQLAWRRSKINSMGKDLADQEYPYCWQDAFLASGRTRFDMDEMATALMECWSPRKHMNLEGKRFVEIKDPNGYLKVWEEPKAGFRYAIGADVALGLKDGDYSCADVLEVRSGRQVAQWHGHIAPDLFAEELFWLGKWYNNALLCVESNNHGLTTNIKLREKNYPNLYVQTVLQDRGSSEKETRKIGFDTQKNNKRYIIDELAGLLRDKDTGIACKETIEECQTYIILENGATEAAPKCFDDRVMSMAIAKYAVTQHPAHKKK